MVGGGFGVLDSGGVSPQGVTSAIGKWHIGEKVNFGACLLPFGIQAKEVWGVPHLSEPKISAICLSTRLGT
jgi:hypothetical protein